nr:MAG TPA: hypothetical protein [Caudoviricetes sp.]
MPLSIKTDCIINQDEELLKLYFYQKWFKIMN